MKQIVTKFTDNDLYTFTCQFYILQKYPRAEVEYTFFDRNGTVYPKGFAELLKEQMEGMRSVVITDEEVEFLRKRCAFLPKWYVEVFLRGYRFNPNELDISQDEEGHLHVQVKGKWYSTIMWEMPILSTVSELMHTLNGDKDKYDYKVEIARVDAKAALAKEGGIKLADMGTRRRFSFDHQSLVLSRLIKGMDNGNFTGTSNVYFAMKYGITPIGTMSHQIVSFEETVSGLFECNYNVMNKWSEVYDGNVGIYLYDCFGDEVFFNNLSKRMAMMYVGLRVDSGVEEMQVSKIVDKYNSLGIDATHKQVVFSNGLSIERAIEIHNNTKELIMPSFGIGTQLTCDVTDVDPMNIVVKLTRARITEFRPWVDAVKLSCNKTKTLGNPDKCAFLIKQIESQSFV